MGYTPAMFEDYSPGTLYCPSPDMGPRRSLGHDGGPAMPGMMNMYGNDPASTVPPSTMPPALSNTTDGRWSPMMDLPDGMECLEGRTPSTMPPVLSRHRWHRGRRMPIPSWSTIPSWS